MRKKKILIQLLAAAAAAVVAASAVLTGCSGAGTPADVESTVSYTEDQVKIQEDFDAFVDDLTKETLTLDLLSLHYTLEHPENYGITEYDKTLGEVYNTDEKYDEYYSEAEEEKAELMTYDRADLTEDQQIIYDMLEENYDDIEGDRNFDYYYNYLASETGDQNSIVTAMGSYRIAEEKDVKEYLGLMKDIPRYFDELIIYAKAQAERGLLMSDASLELTISQCETLLKSQDDGYLITSFERKIDELDLSDDKKDTYKKQNRSILKDKVFPAYENLITELKALKGSSKRKGGLCELPNGKEFYERIIQGYVGSEHGMDEIRKSLEEDYEKNRMSAAAAYAANPEVAQEMIETEFDLSDPKKVLKDLTKAMSAEFNLADGGATADTAEVQPIPEEIRDFTALAYYMSPQLDDTEHNYIYVNQEQTTGTIYDLTVYAHEGLPGHMYQITYFCQKNEPLVRYVLNYSCYTEGWGMYAERMIVKHVDGLSEEAKTFAVAYYDMIFDLQCLADIGVNYDGWSAQEMIDFFSEYGLPVEEDYYQTLVDDPGNNLKYVLGYMEFKEMKEKAMNELGDSFDAKAFHKFLLDLGPAPFDLVNDKLDRWISSQK